jgi:hypothetical protein
MPAHMTTHAALALIQRRASGSNSLSCPLERKLETPKGNRRIAAELRQPHFGEAARVVINATYRSDATGLHGQSNARQSHAPAEASHEACCNAPYPTHAK